MSEDYPWRDESTLRHLYIDRGLSTHAIADKLGCSQDTVRTWMDRCGVDARDHADAVARAIRSRPAHFETTNRGYERWTTETNGSSAMMSVHRLLAVSEFGIDAVKSMDVHHKNGIPWDNRPENIEPLSRAEHRKEHREIKKPERLAIAALYDATNLSQKEVADRFGTADSMVHNIHNEVFVE